MHLRKRLIIPAAGTLAIAALLGAYQYWMHGQGNFHAITPGAAYRSAQLDRDELSEYTARYGIRSVINLRGSSATGEWYREEVGFCAAQGIGHYDLELSASREPTDAEADSLVALFRSVRRPVLIHCMAGADRSGYATALWRLAIEHAPPGETGRALSIIYGHLPFGKTRAMDRAFERYVARYPGPR
jgi:protein tyrosine/serine phosphatase